MALKKINYNGSSKVILRLCEMVNQLIDGGGGGGSTVSYTQTLQSGTKTGSISIDGVSTDMYAPTQPTNVSDLTNDAGYLTSSDVSAVAMSGSYSDLSNTPTLGTAAAENVGVANGVAELDANGKVPSSQLPSYVDDVIEGYYDSVTDRFYEESTFTTVIPPESGKSWVDIPSNKSYRWTGSVYTRVDEGVQLGETSSTAYRGDRGKTAYDHSQSDHSTITPAFTEASTRANIATGESIATIFGKIKKYFTDLKAVAFSGSYSDLSNTPTIPDELADLADDSAHRVVTDTEKSTWNGKSDFSGSYNDLTDKPTIPTVNNGTLTIKQNGTTVGTFSANQSGNTEVDITGGGGATYTEGDGIDISAQNVISVDTTFSEASTRTNIASGDTFATILGKIKKFFTDLKDLAFIAKDGASSTKYLRGDGTWQVFPTIPAEQIQSDWNQTTTTAKDYIKNKPTIPSNTSQLTNDSNFITATGANLITMINALGIGNSDCEEDDYFVSQYAGGNREGNTNYYRRPVSKLVAFIKTKLATVASSGSYSDLSDTPSVDDILDTLPIWSAVGTDTTYFIRQSTDGASSYGKVPFSSLWTYIQGKTDAKYVNLGGSEMTGNLTLRNSSGGDSPALQFVRGSGSDTYTDLRIFNSLAKLLFQKRDSSTGYAWSTYCQIDSSGNFSGSSAKLNGASEDAVGNTVNTIVKRDSDGYVRSYGFRSASSSDKAKINGGGCYIKSYDDSGYTGCFASSFTNMSSKKFKENIKPITEDEAEKLLDVEVVTYDYKEDAGIISGDARLNQRGVIAEQVENIIPSVITYEEEDGKMSPNGVDYSKFVPYLIKMVQIQQEEINNLKAEISALKMN